MFRRKKHLQESIDDLVKDADEIAYEAEFKMDMKLLVRSKDLRKICTSKKT